MAKKQNYYYVLVMTNDGPVFVTGIPQRNWANYNKNEKPMQFSSKEMAQEVAFGLSCNMQLAYAVCQSFEIDYQPYRYADGHFEWVENTADEKSEENSEK